MVYMRELEDVMVNMLVSMEVQDRNSLLKTNLIVDQ